MLERYHLVNISDYFRYDESAPYLLINLKDRGSKAKAGNPTHGSKTSHGYYVAIINKKPYLLHMVIWELKNGKIPAGYEIDHINMDRADNRICNLRLASRSQNGCNRSNSKNRLDASLPKGIYYHQSWGRTYQAKICIQGKKFSKASTNIEELVAWLEKKRSDLHGEFARSI